MSPSYPKVSVILPSYNHEKYVQKAIESVILQTYDNIELIVIDDGSKDNSPIVLKNLQEKYGFYLECRSNHGLVQTLNYALKNLVTGKYVCLLASDDFWAPERIKKQVSIMEQNPEYGFCHTPVYLIDSNNTIISDYNQNTKKEGYVFEELLSGKTNIAATGVMVPLKIYEEVGYYDEMLPIEDYPMWLKISASYPIGYLNEHLVYYRIHDFNMSKNELKMLKAEEMVISQWEKHSLYPKVKPEIFLRWFAKYAKFDKIKALKYLVVILGNIQIYSNKNLYKGLRRLFFYWK